jgi:hypothetical protein
VRAEERREKQIEERKQNKIYYHKNVKYQRKPFRNKNMKQLSSISNTAGSILISGLSRWALLCGITLEFSVLFNIDQLLLGRLRILKTLPKKQSLGIF